jgi:hypothetical protein
MKAKRMLELIDAYEERLKKHKGAKAKEFETGGVLPARTDVVNHGLWSCERVRQLVEEERFEKAAAVLKFAQGALWAAGFATINELKQADD